MQQEMNEFNQFFQGYTPSNEYHLSGKYDLLKLKLYF